MKQGELAVLWAEIEASLSDLDRIISVILRCHGRGSEKGYKGGG